MKKRQGFTLVELLGVITVLGLIALIAFPIITGSINKAKSNISEATAKVLYSNGESYIKENINNYKLTEDNVFCVSLQQLADAGKINTPVTDAQTGKNIPLTKTLKFKVTTNRKLTHDLNLYDPSECSAILESTEFIFDYTGGVQTFTAPKDGDYRIELWGAGTNDYAGGKGAYTSGVITLQRGDRLYVYVGESGKKGSSGNEETRTMGSGAVATFNGGGAGGNASGSETYGFSNYAGGNSGGGATDVRLVGGAWNDAEGLKSRIMVAGGGGGHVYKDAGYDNQKGNAGTTNGEQGALPAILANYPSDIAKRGTGGTQTSGSAFGVGGNGANAGTTGACGGHSGGGGGYFGGFGGSSTGGNCHNMGGGGGSSFVSGCTGCRAVLESGAIGTSNTHYSGKVFKQIEMIGGNAVMPNPRGTVKITGNEGNGFARITIIEK